MKYLMIQLTIVLLLTACSNTKNGHESIKSDPPNIIFIMTDDHTRQAISAYGSIINQTPNIDRIANQGMRFDNCFVTNSICAPSRATILTGKYSHLNGVTDNSKPFDSTQQTFPKILQSNGYETAIVGKWHLKSTPTGFDFWNILPDQGDYYNPEFIQNGDTIKHTGYVTDIITQKAIDWLDKRKDNEQPFLLLYQHKAPHRNWLPGPDHLTLYNDVDIPIPGSFFDEHSSRSDAARENELHIMRDQHIKFDSKYFTFEEMDQMEADSYSDYFIPMFTRLNDEQRQAWKEAYDPVMKEFQQANLSGDELAKWKYQRYLKDYLRCVASVDDNIGRFLDYLDANGMAENTLIIYTSDQGFFLGEHGWFDKRFMYEESFGTPLIAKWPAVIKPGSVSTNLVSNLDFAETILDVAGAAVPKSMQGESLLPLFKGEEPNWRKNIYYHYYENHAVHHVKRHYGIRTDRYKLIHFYHDIDQWELYDLEKDPNEMKNVYHDPYYEVIKNKLYNRLLLQMKKYGDSEELRNEILQEDSVLYPFPWKETRPTAKK